MESERGATTAAAAPSPRKAQPERSQLARRHVLRGAAFAIVTALLLSVLGRPGSRDDAASRERPPSSTADVYEQGELTPLQRHVAFFDRDKDGVIYASETYQGERLRVRPPLCSSLSMRIGVRLMTRSPRAAN